MYGTETAGHRLRRPPRPVSDLDDVVSRAERAEERLRHQTLVFAEAEHKLKTSLAVISGWATTLDDRWDVLTVEQRREGIAGIRRSADSLALQTRVLLEEARTEMGRLDPAPMYLDLAEILRATTPTFDGLSHRHDIRCDVVEAVPVWADPAGLQQVLGHLVENAVKYSPSGGVISVGARAYGDWAQLTVADEGIGLPEDIDVFAAFTRGPAHHDDSKNGHGHGGASSVDGIGLGLYIVRKLVEGMGGSVTAAPNPVRGSTFTVLLPAVGR
jgi:signal transduction histidine kinase